MTRDQKRRHYLRSALRNRRAAEHPYVGDAAMFWRFAAMDEKAARELFLVQPLVTPEVIVTPWPESPVSELTDTLSLYLRRPSVDGAVERQTLRQKLQILLEPPAMKYVSSIVSTGVSNPHVGGTYVVLVTERDTAKVVAQCDCPTYQEAFDFTSGYPGVVIHAVVAAQPYGNPGYVVRALAHKATLAQIP